MQQEKKRDLVNNEFNLAECIHLCIMQSMRQH